MDANDDLLQEAGDFRAFADEMGLGKTIQTMTFLEQLSRLKSTQVRGPFLVVAPLTLVAQWQGEAAAWAPVCLLYFLMLQCIP